MLNNLFLFFFIFILSLKVFCNTNIIIGTDNGIYFVNEKLVINSLLTNYKIKKIIPTYYGYFFLSENNILFSSNLIDYVVLPPSKNYQTILCFDNTSNISILKVGKRLKDLKIDPFNSNNLITSDDNSIYFTTNKGINWITLKLPDSLKEIKSICIFTLSNLNILFSHPFKGVYLCIVNKGNYKWRLVNNGLRNYAKYYEEVSDFCPVKINNNIFLFSANNFYPYIYSFDFNKLKWNTVYYDNSNFNIIESLFFKDNKIYFVSTNNIFYLNLFKNNFELITSNLITKYNVDSTIKDYYNFFKLNIKTQINSICVILSNEVIYNFSHLDFLEDNNQKDKIYFGKKGIYLYPSTVKNNKKFSNIINVLNDNKLNMVVIDMKDDWGYLRFYPTNHSVKEIAKVISPINLDEFVRTMKSNNIYLIARMVVFKDKVLYEHNNNIYALKSKSKNNNWKGIITRNNNSQESKEFWVDPSNVKVWEYVLLIAKELIERGFHEIQLDYIRFPTDAENLDDIYYEGMKYNMNKEDVIKSFLKYFRENINAPISIDIYGANGWFRTGARTGQDVSLLKDYVDIICPMFYPSHFSENFLNYPPEEDRTFRIYYYGTLRNYYIGEKKVLIRPYVQAFNLKTQFDKKYYNKDYIINEIKGVDLSLNMGYTFWNMDNNYKILYEVYSNY